MKLMLTIANTLILSITLSSCGKTGEDNGPPPAPAPVSEPASTPIAAKPKPPLTKAEYDKSIEAATDGEKKLLKKKMLQYVDIMVALGQAAAIAGHEDIAVSRFKNAVEFGNADAQYELGRAYCEGIGGLPKSENDCAMWIRKAADQGQPSAAYILFGDLYTHGKRKEAMHWGEIAAKGGDANAQLSFSIALANESKTQADVKPELKKALYWAKLSEKQGKKEAKEVSAKINEMLRDASTNP